MSPKTSEMDIEVQFKAGSIVENNSTTPREVVTARCHPRHLTLVEYYEIRRPKPSCRLNRRRCVPLTPLLGSRSDVMYWNDAELGSKPIESTSVSDSSVRICSLIFALITLKVYPPIFYSCQPLVGLLVHLVFSRSASGVHKDATPEVDKRGVLCGNKPLKGSFVAPEQLWPFAEQKYDPKNCQGIYSQFGFGNWVTNRLTPEQRFQIVQFYFENNGRAIFSKRILLVDEAHFWLNGYVNKEKVPHLSEANPQVYVETPLHPEKLTVCALYGQVESLVRNFPCKNDEGQITLRVNGDGIEP
ncbi:hypothetical protein TNCV_3117311 [Trichonephila clavipes]|nr:hypothetical protein TNCV_3117311 [Trichonephila clavipes]